MGDSHGGWGREFQVNGKFLSDEFSLSLGICILLNFGSKKNHKINITEAECFIWK